MEELDDIWELVLEELRKDFSNTSMSIWFNDLKLASLTESSAILLTDAGFKKGILENRYRTKIEKNMEAVIGYPVKISFELNTGADFPSSSKKNDHDTSASQQESIEIIEKATENNGSDENERINKNITMISTGSDKKNSQKISSPKNSQNDVDPDRTAENEIRIGEHDGDIPYYATGGEMVSKVINQVGKYKTEYTFENFIVGTSNTFAHAACTAVAQNPATAYNPLFIYGPSGLGKTHLLYAITNKVTQCYPNYNILYVKGEEFTNQMIESIGKNLNQQFRERYRKADMLLIDDIQFIAGREATQEEFFHTFNALYEDHKQIIMTSDRPPKDIKTLEDRLRTRFEWGLTVDVQPPDYELRIAIMKKKAEGLGMDFPNDVLAFLAENLTNNVRQIEGAIKKISAFSYMSGMPINVQMANNCVSDMISSSGPVKVTSDRIIAKVSQKYCVSKEDIYSKKRASNITNARHICVYLMRKLSEMSYKQIGRVLSKDHTTIIHSYETIETEIQHNTQLEIEINELINELKN